MVQMESYKPFFGSLLSGKGECMEKRICGDRNKAVICKFPCQSNLSCGEAQKYKTVFFVTPCPTDLGKGESRISIPQSLISFHVLSQG